MPGKPKKRLFDLLGRDEGTVDADRVCNADRSEDVAHEARLSGKDNVGGPKRRGRIDPRLHA
jgi:hypothetical protein